MRLRIAIVVLAVAAGGGLFDREVFVTEAQQATPDVTEVEARQSTPELTGDVIVKFKDGTTLAGVGATLDQADTAPVQVSPSGAVLLTPDDGQSVDDAVAALNADPNVAYAEPDVLVTIDATPNDTYYGAYQAWHFEQINAPAAWDVETGDASTVVAVVDTGVQSTHVDLDGNMVGGANFVSIPIASSSNSGGRVRITTNTAHPYLNGEQVTITGHSVGSVNGTWTISVPAALTISSASINGGTATITTTTPHNLSVGEFVMVRESLGGTNGQWFVNGVLSATQFQFTCLPDCGTGIASDTGGIAKQSTWFELVGSTYTSNGTSGGAVNGSPRDDEGHGTTVSGFIAAESDNGAGVAGVCWTCKIMPVKVLGATGSGSSLAVAAGIEWAVDNGADVINLSLSSPSSTQSMLDAVNYASTNGVIVVAASGNDGDTLDPSVRYPAKYSNVIAVGATDSGGIRADFSNYGPELDVVAPGETVTSTSATGWGDSGAGWYATGSGTSFAAPHVAGVVGLMISHGITDPTDIVDALTSTAVDAGSAGFDNEYGHGIVDAAAALGGGADTTPPVVAITSPAEGATVSGTVTIDATVSDASGIEKVRFWAGHTYMGYDISSPYGVSWDTSGVANGPYRLRIQAFDNAGNTASTFVDVTVANDDAALPVVTITSPDNGDVVSGTISFNVSASDLGGLEKVQFWAGTEYLGYDVAPPYRKTLDTTTFADGPAFMRARAIDWAGNYSEHVIGVTVVNNDTTPPAVSISSPSNGDTLSGDITVTAAPTDDIAVQKVQYWVDGTYLGYEISAPWTRSIDTSGLTNGVHLLTVRAWDWGGNASPYVNIGVTVANGDAAAPQVTITSHADGATVSGTIVITADATDDAGVEKVQFWFSSNYLSYDLSAPYSRSFDTTTVPDGAYWIRARAVDWTNKRSDHFILVNVDN